MCASADCCFVTAITELYLNNFQRKPVESFGMAKPTGLNFTADEEYQEVNRDRQRFVQREVARLLKMVEDGKEIIEPTEPDVILAFCSETIKTMTRDSRRSVNQCEELIERLDSYKSLQSSDSIRKISRVVELVTDNILKMNIDKLSPSQFEEYVLKERISTVERDILNTFDKTQRDVALRVLRVMNGYFKPVMKAKSTMTSTSSKDVDRAVLSKQPSPEKSVAAKAKLTIEEREVIKKELDTANSKAASLESLSKELMETITQKDSEIFYLVKKYEIRFMYFK